MTNTTQTLPSRGLLSSEGKARRWRWCSKRGDRTEGCFELCHRDVLKATEVCVCGGVALMLGPLGAWAARLMAAASFLAVSWHSSLLSICLPSNDIPVLIKCTASNLLWAGNWIPWTCWNAALSERPSLTLPSKIVLHSHHPPCPHTWSATSYPAWLSPVACITSWCYLSAFISDGLPSSLGYKCQEDT